MVMGVWSIGCFVARVDYGKRRLTHSSAMKCCSLISGIFAVTSIFRGWITINKQTS
jgi:hypothetical protein